MMNNLAKRIFSGAVFGAVIICGIWLFPQLYPLVAVYAMCNMLSEFYTMSMGKTLMTERVLSLLAAVSFFILLYFLLLGRIGSGMLLFAALPLLAMLLCPVLGHTRDNLDKFPMIFTGLLYIGLPVCLSPFVMIRDGVPDGHLMMGLIFIVWASDIGAYAIGSTLGQREGQKRLAPGISPKKSWWGFGSALFFGAVCSVVLQRTGFIEMSLPVGILTGLTVGAGSVAGDLVESVWKRHYLVKDSGSRIPGHGGYLDRFDSSLIAIPAGYIILTLLCQYA